MNLWLSGLRLVVWWLAAFGAGGHELCMDGSAPERYSRMQMFSTCRQYMGPKSKSCLEPAVERRTVPKRLKAFKIDKKKDADCYEHMKKVVCGEADPWSAHLYDGEGGTPRITPFLCDAYAKSLYQSCKDVTITRNPFLTGRATGALTSEFADENAFATANENGDSPAMCYSGIPFEPPADQDDFTGDPAHVFCVERLTALEYPSKMHATVVPVPGHPTLLALGSLDGVVHIVRLGAVGQAATFLGTLLDWRNKVAFKGERGLLGLAFHKNFASNGRLFISYSCKGVMYCGTLGTSIIEELRVADPSNENALTVDTSATKKIVLRVRQPYGNHNGGQILFSPANDDGNLYVMFGDGGSGGDPEENAQNTRSMLGKILRLDIDSKPLRGKGYAYPKDNPYISTRSVLSEIWALGLRNPWRCSFDSANPAYFICGDVGQKAVEEVSIISKGGNYGWPRYEGTRVYSSAKKLSSTGGLVQPIIEYSHVFNGGSYASVTGGFIYRGSSGDSDSRLFAKYFFADFYGKFYVSEENPVGSGHFIDPVRFSLSCSSSSPLPCNSTATGRVFTFGEDASHELLFVNQHGLHRLVAMSNCI